ncbi:MAG: N-terminal phage integrase SAM-like domain-containing protein [Ellagibacter isourolithinifaciens]|nr:N-terminal phage integrase SAM-like domain-containing protein [Ellagibacter isourolithinifaciens]MDD7690270.1 N-terminal phage integrase SAM-like domain-containing protein [Ellagibacter isourolithinifaciens]MDY6112052.1 N-terminal phage integrase SAM-like domain-containing protein [Ellagibacter isourolithinifaciens]
MTFEQFVKVYAEDVRPRLRETTWRSKEHMINEKLVPFFGEMRVVDITS